MNTRAAMRHRATWIAAAFIAFSPSPLDADVVFGVKQRCPTGSLGMLSHTGPWCQAVGCKVDEECGDFFERDRSDASVKAPKEPMVCVEYGVCVKTESVQQRGGWSGGKTITKEIAIGACDPAGSCPSGATCSRDKRCIPSRLASAAPTGAQDAGAPSVDPTPAPPDASAPASPTAAPAEDVPPATSCGRCAAGGERSGGTSLLAVAAWALALAVVAVRRSHHRTRR